MQVRPIRVEGDIAYVPLTRGYEAIVDASDALDVQRYAWRADVRRRKDGTIRTVYAVRDDAGVGKCYLHQHILRPGPGLRADHRDSNGLDCRRSNLRVATKPQNSQNSAKRVDCSSGVKGVSWHKLRRKWQVHIKAADKRLFLGLFVRLEDAAAAYAAASAKHHGEFGRTA